jgi:hypothetical protein
MMCNFDQIDSTIILVYTRATIYGFETTSMFTPALFFFFLCWRPGITFYMEKPYVKHLQRLHVDI